MASVEYQNSILWRGDDPSKRKFKPKYDNSHKVERYFPGQVPRWANAEDEDVAEVLAPKAAKPKEIKRKAAAVEDAAASRLRRLAQAYASPEERKLARRRHRDADAAAVLEEAEDDEGGDELKRDDYEKAEKKSLVKKEEDSDEEKLLILQDLLGQKPEGLKSDDDNDDDLDVHRPAEVKADVVLKKEDVKEEEDDPEVQGLLRANRREQALLKRQAEEKALRETQEEVHVEPEESSSEYESVTDDEAVIRNRTLLKPVFVPQSKRETVKERENIEKEEELQKVKEKENQKKRKLESKDLLLDHIKKDDAAEMAAEQEDLFASDVELPDDDDEKDEAEEYDLWKIRELKRIKREREERAARQKEIEFIERRRNMTDEERAAEDAKLDAQASKKEDSKNFGFLQKYYHRGGYFQDKAVNGEEPLYLRDYHQPLEEEKFDKNLLPKAMQVRRGLFGKKGQVKHTHLTEVDTTDFSAHWSQGGKMVQNYQMKMAGAKGVNNFDRPGVRGGV